MAALLPTLPTVPSPNPGAADAATITVRRVRPADAAALASLMADPGVYGALLQLPMPSEEMWKTRIETRNAPDRSDLQLVAERDGRIVGSAGLHPVTLPLRRRHVAMLGISVAVAAQRQGVGTALMQAMCDYADNWAQLLRIELTVFADNTRATGLYQKFGFRHEGTHRAYAMRDGQFADVHSMARLHPRPPVVAWAG